MLNVRFVFFSSLRRLVPGAGIWAVVSIGGVFAAEVAPMLAQEPDFSEMSLEQLGSIKVPTVYGASKHEQKITEAPAAVSIVTSDEIKKQGHRTLGDILRSVRGVYVVSDRGYNGIGVRGVNRPGDFGGRLLITVDGHRMNDAIYDTAASDTDFVLDVDLIERVEVIRGPGSSLYGNNAVMGVVNIITRKGSDLNGGEVAGSYGTFDTYTGRVSYGNTFTNGVELLLSGTLNSTEGNRRLYFPEFANVNNGVAEDIDGGWSRHAMGRLAWKGLSLETGYVDRKKTWPTAPYTTPGALVLFNDPRFFTIDERLFADLKFQKVFEHELELSTRVYYDRYRFDAQYPYDYLDPLQPVYLNIDDAQADSLGAEIQLSKTVFEKHHVTVGTEARGDFQLIQNNYDLAPRTSYLDSHESGNFSVFTCRTSIKCFPA